MKDIITLEGGFDAFLEDLIAARRYKRRNPSWNFVIDSKGLTHGQLVQAIQVLEDKNA